MTYLMPDGARGSLAGERMKLLVLSHLFPSGSRPTLGLFVQERVRHMACSCEVTVVVPIKATDVRRWRPFRERFSNPDGNGGFDVWYLPLVSVPLVHWLTPLLLACRILSHGELRNAVRRASVLDCHWTHPEAFAATLLGRIFSKPVFITLRGVEAFYRGQGLIREFELGIALSRAAGLVGLSTQLLELAETAAGMPLKKSRVISNGVDTERFRPGEQDSARRNLGVPYQGMVFLSVGRLPPGKGFHRLIGCWQAFVRLHPGALLYVVGGDDPEDPSYRRKLTQQISTAGLESHVFLAGEARNQALVQWYQAADFFLLASSSEGSPNVVLEALASGLPCAVSDVGGVAEILSDSGLGLLVTDLEQGWSQALNSMVEKDWDREQIRSAMLNRSWTRCADRAVAFMNEVLTDD